MRYTTLFVVWLIAAAAHAESETERQVKKTVIDNNTYAIEQMKADPAIYSRTALGKTLVPDRCSGLAMAPVNGLTSCDQTYNGNRG